MNSILGKYGTIIIDNECCNHEQLKIITNDLFVSLQILEKSYPKFKDWYFKKVAAGLINGSRNLIIEMREGKIVGVAITKNTNLEKKICTIWVTDEYKSKGIGIRLFEKSMLLLNTDKPLASVSEDRLPEFEKIFQYFNYEFVAEYKGLYIPKKSEFSFNNILQ